MTYLPYSFSLMTRLEKSESPERRMKVPISGRVNTSSIASIASRMSVAFFLAEPYAVAKIKSIEDSVRGTTYCGYRRQSAYARCTATFPFTISEERRFLSSVWRSERMPSVTLSKSISRQAFGAWWGPANAVWDIACGPRCIGATCRCALCTGADRWGRGVMNCWITCARLRTGEPFLGGCTPMLTLRQSPQAVRLQVVASASTMLVDRSPDPRSRAVQV